MTFKALSAVEESESSNNEEVWGEDYEDHLDMELAEESYAYEGYKIATTLAELEAIDEDPDALRMQVSLLFNAAVCARSGRTGACHARFVDRM